jgi:hypothetical protein
MIGSIAGATRCACCLPISPDLWSLCDYNPKVFLRRVPQYTLDEVARNLAYLQDYHGVLSDYDTFRQVLYEEV